MTTLIREIGRGSYGVVQEIYGPAGNVARKSLILSDIEEDNAVLRRRFKREVEYQASLNHPNIVRVLDAGLDGKNPWFTMPLAICQLGRESYLGMEINQQDKIITTHMILDGVEAIHRAYKIHRDLKPQNILRFHTPDGKYWGYAISDFGLAADRTRADTTVLTSTGMPIGSYAYMSPECYHDPVGQSSFQSDIYSVGVIIKFIFDGNPGTPFNERTSEKFIESIVRKCTKYNPSERYLSVADLRVDFLRASGQLK